MTKSVVVIAPHPDDETLGCGGTILKHKHAGDRVHWLIVTHMSEQSGFSIDRVAKRNQEIQTVAEKYRLDSYHHLYYPPSGLDQVPMTEIVSKISEVFKRTLPEIVYLPFRGDIHTDHAVVCDAVLSCTKWFRYPNIQKVLAYETLSETDFGINPDSNGFRPNVFVDIAPFLKTKIEIMRIFDSEISEFPFPRSERAIRALAEVRGAASGFTAAEAFMLLRERWSK